MTDRHVRGVSKRPIDGRPTERSCVWEWIQRRNDNGKKNKWDANTKIEGRRRKPTGCTTLIIPWMFNFYLPAKNTVPLFFFFFNSWPNSLEFLGFFSSNGKKLLYPFFFASQWKNAAEPHVVPPVDDSEFVLGGSRVTLPGCCRLIRSSASLTWPIKLSRCCLSVRPPGCPPTHTHTHWQFSFVWTGYEARKQVHCLLIQKRFSSHW